MLSWQYRDHEVYNETQCTLQEETVAECYADTPPPCPDPYETPVKPFEPYCYKPISNVLNYRDGVLIGNWVEQREDIKW